MPIIDLEQGSPAWLEYRKTKIMATDSSIILGVNPFTTIKELWEEKLEISPPKQMNDAMRRGQRLEPEARELANKVVRKKFIPCVHESDIYPWMAASLDGLSVCQRFVLEIKCPGERTHQMAFDGIIPEYYMIQMQHQLATTACEQAFYFSYRPEAKTPYGIIEVMPDKKIIEEIIDRGYYFFHNNMCSFKEPLYMEA